MNEEVAGQLHSGLISITDGHQDRLYRMEQHIEGLEEENGHLKESVIALSKGLADVRMQSVMCHAMLMHYVETHWEPIGRLFGQIGELSGCGIVPPSGTCSCDVVDEPFNSQGAAGPGTPSSLPSLESQSPSIISGPTPSPIDSVYYTPSFLQSMSGPSSNPTQEEEFTVVFQGGSLSSSSATLPPSLSGDSGLFGEVNQGRVVEVSVEGLPLLGDEGWSRGGSDCDVLGSFTGRD